MIKYDDRYRYSYLFQRARYFIYLFNNFSNEIKDLTGLTFEEWKRFHTYLCKLIEKLIIKEENNYSSDLWIFNLNSLRKVLNSNFSSTIEYCYFTLNLDQIHLIKLSDLIFDMLDKKLMSIPKYNKKKAIILERLVTNLFKKFSNPEIKLYNRIWYSNSEIDLISTYNDYLIIVEVKNIRKSNLNKLVKQLKVRMNSIKQEKVLNLLSRDKKNKIVISLENKELIYLGVIYDDPFEKIESINQRKDIIDDNIIFMTYFNFEAIVEMLIHENTENPFNVLFQYISYRIDQKSLDSFAFGDEIQHFKWYFFYDRNKIQNYKDFKKLIDFNYDIVDKKYDRVRIKRLKKIKRPLPMYGATFSTNPLTGKFNFDLKRL